MLRLHAGAIALLLAFPAPVLAQASEGGQALGLVNLLRVTTVPAALPDAAGHPEIERLLGQPSDLWERIRLGFGMPPLEHPLVTRYEAWYAGKPDLVRAILTRARRYLHFIVEEVERRGMPTELALLPIVESGFDPKALSAAQASGLWQFIPSTGTRYNLEQNAHYDARRDILASTGAALDYLQFLYGQHKDWHLALASYNWGENAVTRAAERSRGRGAEAEFGKLSLPEETRHYVPRLQAVKNLIADPAKFGFDLGELPNEPYFAVIPNRADVPLAAAARLAGMSQEEFTLLNPAWKLPRIPGDKGPGLVLPVDRVESFRANFARWEEEQRLEKARQKPRSRKRGS